MNNDNIEYKGTSYIRFDTVLDWEKAEQYYNNGELAEVLESNAPSFSSEWFRMPYDLKDLLNFYFDSPPLVRAIVDNTCYLQNNSSLAREIVLAIDYIEGR